MPISWRSFGLCNLLLAICAVFLYLPTLDYSFFADDHFYLGLKNTFLYELPAAEVWRLVIQRANPWEFLPVRDFTYWLDIALLGPDAEGFHASNLIWYTLACWSAFLAARSIFRLFLDDDEPRVFALAMTTMLFFALHPAHVESVAWISGRKELLSGLFCLLSVAYFLDGIRCQWSLPLFVLSAACWMLACFSKSVVVGFLPVFWLLAVCAMRRWPPARRRNVGVYLLVPTLISIAALSVHVIVGQETGVQITNTPTLFDALERASRILTALLSILAVPIDLRLFYDIYALPAWHWLLSILALAAGFFATRQLFFCRGGVLWIAVVAMLFPLLPYLQLFPFSTWSLASDRFVFLSVFGLALGGAVLLPSVRSKSIMLAIVVVFSVFCALILFWRIPEWNFPSRLRTAEVRYSPTYYNAVREYVQYELILERKDRLAKQYVEGISNPLAKELLFGYARLAQKYRVLLDNYGHNALEDLRTFCVESGAFSEQLTQSKKTAVSNPDIVFTSFLVALDKDVGRWRQAFTPRCDGNDFLRN